MIRRIGALLLAAAALGAGLPAAAAPPQGSEEITPRLVAAVDRGLDYLAQAQQKDGSWLGDVGFKLNQEYRVQEQRVPHVGVTALCGMAFLAGGHLPDRGPYAEVVRRTIAYVMSHSCENGYVTDSGTRMYSHAFATLFLAEAYGMAGGPDVKLALERATQLITDTQNQYGGWRYNPFDREVDLSVTVCQVQALRAARNIGIRVPVQTIDRAVAYVQ
ncbi:MAG TPA: prenyltransferase, partial [Planctomycetota bacterium]|nr:prenyltransferase [Planctomycetota bacterium]